MADFRVLNTFELSSNVAPCDDLYYVIQRTSRFDFIILDYKLSLYKKTIAGINKYRLL